MNLNPYLRAVRAHWWIVVVVGIVGLATAAGWALTRQPQYAARTTLFVSVAAPQASVAEIQDGGLFTQQRVKTYAQVLTSQDLMQRVITRLDLADSPDTLAARVRVERDVDTVLLDIHVTDTSARRAADIARTLATEAPDFIAPLETAPTRSSSPVRISVIRPAAVPTAPVSPNVPLALILGLVAGTGAGIGAALLRNRFDTRIRDRGALERVAGRAPLAVIPFDAQARRQPVVDGSQVGGRAEAFRTLRTNLRFADVDRPPRTIVVTGPLPAEGKTSAACSLALTLALGGGSVALVDGDLRKPSIGPYLGIDGEAGVTSVLIGRHRLEDALVDYGNSGVRVLPSGPRPPNPSELLGSQQMSQLLDRLAEQFDHVVIDAPPLLPATDAALLAARSDGALLVVRRGRTREAEVGEALERLRAVSAHLIGTVLNFAPVERGRRYDYASPAERRTGLRERPRRRGAATSTRPAPHPVPGGGTSQVDEIIGRAQGDRRGA